MKPNPPKHLHLQIFRVPVQGALPGNQAGTREAERGLSGGVRDGRVQPEGGHQKGVSDLPAASPTPEQADRR